MVSFMRQGPLACDSTFIIQVPLGGERPDSIAQAIGGWLLANGEDATHASRAPLQCQLWMKNHIKT
jgi:hypothetical protein